MQLGKVQRNSPSFATFTIVTCLSEPRPLWFCYNKRVFKSNSPHWKAWLQTLHSSHCHPRLYRPDWSFPRFWGICNQNIVHSNYCNSICKNLPRLSVTWQSTFWDFHSGILTIWHLSFCNGENVSKSLHHLDRSMVDMDMVGIYYSPDRETLLSTNLC